MKKHHYEPYRYLQNHGVDVPKTRQPPMNAGGESETTPHYVAKQLVALIGARDHGYMTGVEVDTPTGEIDAVLWGVSDRLTYAVEVETSPTQETKDDKQERYVEDLEPIDDMLWVNVSEMPLDMLEAEAYIKEETGL